MFSGAASKGPSLQAGISKGKPRQPAVVTLFCAINSFGPVQSIFIAKLLSAGYHTVEYDQIVVLTSAIPSRGSELS